MHKSQEAVENCGTYFTLLCIYFFAHVFIDSWRDENKACKPANFFFLSCQIKCVRLVTLLSIVRFLQWLMSATHVKIHFVQCTILARSARVWFRSSLPRGAISSNIRFASCTWNIQILISGIMDPFRVLCACGWISCWQKLEINLYKSDQLSTFVIVPKIWRGWYMCL